MTGTILDLTDNQYKELKKAYVTACSKHQKQFTVFGQDCLTEFAKYWINAVEDRRIQQKRRLYQKDSLNYWHWKDTKKVR